MMEVISFPPLSNGGISDFFLVPIFSSKECNKEIDDCNPGCISGTISPVNHTTIPALLLISQSSIWNEFDENEYDFHNENCRNQSGSRSRKKSAINVYDIGNKFDENDVSSEDYIDNVRGSKGKELSLLPCPIGVSTIPTSASGATPIAIAVAIAVAITDATSPNGKEAEGFGGSIMRSFLPSETIANVTCLNALLPCTVLTSLAAVLSLPKVDDMASKNPASRFDKGETHKNTRRSSFENSEGEGLGPEPIENKEVKTCRFYTLFLFYFFNLLIVVILRLLFGIHVIFCVTIPLMGTRLSLACTKSSLRPMIMEAAAEVTKVVGSHPLKHLHRLLLLYLMILYFWGNQMGMNLE